MNCSGPCQVKSMTESVTVKLCSKITFEYIQYAAIRTKSVKE